MGLAACSSKSPSVTGDYTSYLPEAKMRHDLKVRHNASIAPMWVMMISLREDSSFIMGSCDLQIWEAGTYFIRNDSLVFDNIYSFKDSSYIAGQVYLFDEDKGYIYYRYPNKDSTTNLIYPEAIALLRKDFKRSHYGFLRNEHLSLDSLKMTNKFQTLAEQGVWLKKKLLSSEKQD